jgi:hypothetical protein
MTQITLASARRAKRFVDDFVRSEYVEAWTAEKDVDFIDEPERASRVAKAAAFGGDGKTHAEVIEDWREAFTAWVRDRRRWNDLDRFSAAVEARFAEIEEWHQKNGSLHEQIG